MQLKTRPLLKNLSVALLTCALMLCIAEIALPHLIRTEKVTLIHDPLLGFRGRPDMSTTWVREMAGKPRTVRMNSEGFHDFDRSREKLDGGHRMIFLGDSFLEAYQVEIDHNFSQRLGRRLSARAEPLGFSVEAVNQGLHGYGLGVYYLYTENRLWEWHPDSVVLVLFLGNDLHDNYARIASTSVPRFRMEGDQLTHLAVPEWSVKIWTRDHILARSAIGRMTWMYLIKTNPLALRAARATGMVSTPNTDTQSQKNIAEMTDIAHQMLSEIAQRLRMRQVGLFVYVIPDPLRIRDLSSDVSHPPHTPQLRASRAFIERQTRAMLEGEGIEYHYPLDQYRGAASEGREIYRGGFGHFTESGHTMTADLMEPYLWEMVAAGSR